jgi:hypothetical protein
MIVVPYKAEHLMALQLQRGQAYCAPFITEEYARLLEGKFALTALDDEGQPIMVAGVAPIWENRGLVWSFVGRNAGKHFVAIHKACLEVLDAAPYRRLEADTACEFKAGHRWLRMLGFVMEAERMRAYRPDGGDSALYARVKPWPIQ